MKILDIKLEDRIRDTNIRPKQKTQKQKTKKSNVINKYECVTNAKWKWAGHVAITTSWKNQSVVGEMMLWGNREWYGQGQQRTEKVGAHWNTYDVRLANTSIA